MIRIAICDDSELFLQQTKLLIDNWSCSVGHDIATHLFEDGDALIHAHEKNPFDIILLDVIMPLITGIDTAKEIRKKDGSVKIVFLTSSPDFALDSYIVKASNYLIKPVDADKLFICLDELTEEIQRAAKCIIIKGIDATHRVNLSDIEHIEAQRKHVVFFLKNKRTIETIETLYTYENTLTLDDGFFKCHRSYIVNIHHIDNYSHSEIVMRSGNHIPISRSTQKNFEACYFRVIFGKVAEDI